MKSIKILAILIIIFSLSKQKYIEQGFVVYKRAPEYPFKTDVIQKSHTIEVIHILVQIERACLLTLLNIYIFGNLYSNYTELTGPHQRGKGVTAAFELNN